MGILLISLAAGAVIGALSGLAVGWLAAPIPGLLVATAVYFVMGRRVGSQLQAAMMQVQKEIQAQRIENAIQLLEGLKAKYARMQFFAGASIDGQIGAIHFMRGEFQKARPYLEGSFARMWEPQAMLAVVYSKKKEFAKVDEVLEKAARYSPKQGLLWSLWAWIHWKAGEKDKAISILARGKDALGDKDDVLSQNLLALQNNKKMKMKGYGEAWYTFQLEKHPMLKKAARGGNVRFARR
jgi:tetratricopeptide (TPR) repeat protein